MCQDVSTMCQDAIFMRTILYHGIIIYAIRKENMLLLKGSWDLGADPVWLSILVQN